MKSVSGVLKHAFFGLFLCLGAEALAFQGVDKPFDWDTISQQYTIRHFSVEDGLPINSANYIDHHVDGYLYIATNDGLARFDGHSFFTYKTSNSPAMFSNRIAWVGSSSSGEVWFSDSEKNLYLLKNGAISRLQEIEEYKHLKAHKIAIFDSGRILVTTDQGLYIQQASLGLNFQRLVPTDQLLINSFSFSEDSIFFLKRDGFYKLEDGVPIRKISADDLLIPLEESFINLIITKDGTIWMFGERSQLLKITSKYEQTLYTYSEIGDIDFWDFKEVDSDRLLISTENGYIWFDRGAGKFSASDFISSAEVYFEDNAWTKMDGTTLLKFQDGIYIDDRKILDAQKNILLLSLDREGSVWVATSGDGIYQITKKKMLTIGANIYPGIGNVYGMFEDGEHIWFTSYENGMYRIGDKKITNWNQNNSGLEYIFFRSVTRKFSQNAVYAGNYNLWKYDGNSWSRDESLNEEIGQLDALFEDSKNRFWVGTDNALYLKTPSGVELYADKNGQIIESVRSIQELENGELLISTTGQGIAFLSNNNEFRFITAQNGLSSNLVRDVLIASNDTLWVATEDRGLNRVILDASQKVKEIGHIAIKDGLIDDSLHRIIEDEYGFFWINSNKGIMRIEKSKANSLLNGESPRIDVQSFTEKNGLLNSEGNGGTQSPGLLSRDGRLLFSNQAGIVYTRPEWHVGKTGVQLDQPILETVSYSDTSYSINDRSLIVLPSTVRDINIKFTLPTLSSPRNLILEYKLEGVNDSWQKAGTDRLSVFTNLPAGDHNLVVRGKLAGDKAYVEKSLVIRTLPVFVETVWFIILVIIATIATFIIGFRVLLAQSKRREEKLNSIVRERTQELIIEKERTEEALEHVKELDEFKSRFFTNFTHELRTPLSLILNPLEDMLENSDIKMNGNKESLRLMVRNANRLKSLVNQLLDVSKLSSGELALSFEPVDIVRFTRQIAAQFEHALAKKEIKFKVTGDIVYDPIYLDANAWNHICTNLLSNALKFTPQSGSIVVHVEEQPLEVIISIIDTGQGIPESEIDRVFDSYYQGKSSIASAEGTGIGLALVKGLTERMGGSVSVKSSDGHGCVFSVKLKKGTDHISREDTILTEASIHLASENPKTNGIYVNESQSTLQAESKSSQKVLLVEDNEDFRTYLHSVIQPHYEIEIATNGKQGLEALDKYKPDIIVSDIMMPEMNGYEMMQAIRNMAAYTHIPFIFLSAKDSVVDIEKGLNLGADIYLPKPVKNSLLLAQIKVLLRREKTLMQQSHSNGTPAVSGLIKEVHEIIQRHLGNPDLNVELIAKALSMSPTSLYRNWKKESHKTINQTITYLRLEEAIKLVREEGLNISEVAFAVGYKHLPYFSKAFKKQYGKAPNEYLKNEAAQEN